MTLYPSKSSSVQWIHAHTYLQKIISLISTLRPQLRPIISLSSEIEIGISIFVQVSQGFQCAANVENHWAVVRRKLKDKPRKDDGGYLKLGKSAAKLIIKFKCIWKVLQQKSKMPLTSFLQNSSETLTSDGKQTSFNGQLSVQVLSVYISFHLHPHRSRLDDSFAPYSFRNWSKNSWAQAHASYK